MSGCSQATIKDAAFAPLAGIQSLKMFQCSQASIASARAAWLSVIEQLR